MSVAIAFYTLAAVAALMLSLWVVSLRLRDVSIVDIFWGLGFVMIAWLSFSCGPRDARAFWVAALVTMWGMRLALYLSWRNWGRAEDYRYAAMRRRYGDRFAVVSLYLVFGLQAALMWVVSLPVQAAIIDSRRFHGLDFLGLLLWLLGMGFETVGDWQLARFKSDPANRGKVMDRGLWSWTRHPNYFGDFCVWWGFGCFAFATGAWWALIGPALMSVLLLRVSGVALLERGLKRNKPEYAAYIARTSAFFPCPPRSL